MNKMASRVAARHEKRSYFISSPTNAHVIEQVLLQALASMQGGGWLHWTAHWASDGVASEQDHLLFGEMYKQMATNIDEMAEKIVGMFGSKSIDAYSLLAVSQEHIERFKSIESLSETAQKKRLLRSLAVEEDFQITLRTVYDILENAKALSLGMDDFIMATANQHDVFIYKLQQRIAEESGRSGIEKPPYDFSLVGDPK